MKIFVDTPFKHGATMPTTRVYPTTARASVGSGMAVKKSPQVLQVAVTTVVTRGLYSCLLFYLPDLKPGLNRATTMRVAKVTGGFRVSNFFQGVCHHCGFFMLNITQRQKD